MPIRVDQNSGPPDLEAWFKKLFTKLVPQKRTTLKDLQPPPERGFNTWYGIIPFVIVVSILLSGMVTVKEGEAVVVTRFGVYQSTLAPGMHWTIPFIDRHTSLDMADVQQVNISGLMMTQDQYLVNANIVLNYKIVDARAYLFASQDTDAVAQAYLQAASLQAIQGQSITNLLNKNNFTVLASSIQNNLNFAATTYGIQIQSVAINSMNVPDALNSQFMQTVNQAQNQVNAMIQAAQNYKAAIAPIATRRAQEIQQTANLKRAAIIVAAQANAAEFKALLPTYQKDPAATQAYLPLLLTSSIKNLAPQTATTSTSGMANTSSAQSAYNRWQSANISQSNAQQSQN